MPLSLWKFVSADTPGKFEALLKQAACGTVSTHHADKDDGRASLAHFGRMRAVRRHGGG
jgi:hypothetical protein